MSEVFNSSVLDAINRAVQDGVSTTALEVDGTPQYCIINAETREIEIPGELNIFGVESDEKSTRVYFRCPKYVGTNVDLDMTQCMVYVPYRNANGEKDQYIVTDLNETEDGENVEFTWLISRKASAYMGITEFGIRAIKTATGGTIEAEWNTTVASANVIRGMDVGLLEFSEENKDALTQALDIIEQQLEQTKDEMNSVIEQKGQETLESIPGDYTTAAQNALSAKNEVEGIRVGADGTTYESAGEAVRGQIGSLKEDIVNNYTNGNFYINNTVPYGDMLETNVVRGEFVDYGYLNASGNIIPNLLHRVFKFYLKDVNHVVYKSNVASITVPKVVFFDKNGGVTGVMYHTSNEKDVPNNTEYMYVGDYNYETSTTTLTFRFIDKFATKQELEAYAKNGIVTYVNKPFSFNDLEKWAVFFGDSITKGFTDMGATVTENGYPKLVSDKLGISFRNKGVGGSCYTGDFNNVDTILETIQTIVLNQYSFLFIAGGINDWQLGVPLEVFRTAVKNTFSYVKSNYNGEVIVIAPISANFHNLEIAEIDEYRNILGEETILYGFSFVNGKDFNFPSQNGDLATALFGDGMLHPSEFGYTHYAKCLCNALC